ncbi:GNAT family N-acetyltransferase [Actinoplanes sp. NPDC049265]|uniref:GNAT family N-acetyltransferase n=1 Tax=Actinoplanes sp. NPDC049265 TaxID=3363902 RepID=UPI00371D6D2C
MTLVIRAARESDRDIVAGLWNGASAWLRQLGQDQWQYPVKLDGIEAAIEAGTCWLIEQPPYVTVATVTLDRFADPRLWLPEDKPEDGRYVHRLVVSRDAGIRHLGSAVLDWASMRTEAAGARWLRLDAWTSNTQLHKYYLEHGFHLVRTVQAPGIPSGVLFERRARVTLGLGPAIRELTEDG